MNPNAKIQAVQTQPSALKLMEGRAEAPKYCDTTELPDGDRFGTSVFMLAMNQDIYDDLPEDLRALEQVDRGEALPEEVRIRLLEALWTGVTPGDDAARIGFSSALMWAAIEESNNVISYCGGVPGFWAEPPETA